MKLAEACGIRRFGFSMTIRKGMKPGSGIGSSAASSVGGALAMASLLGITNKDLILEAAGMGEELIAGSRHFDNVAAALFGGFTVVSDARSRTILRIRPPRFEVAVVIPGISVETKRARKLLPDKVPMGDAVANLSWASGMIHAMLTKDVTAVGRYLEDRLALPYRKSLIPAYDDVKEAAMSSGAAGVSIGGSGPTVFAICEDGGERVRKAMAKAFKSKGGLSTESFVTVPGTGARVEK
jgi:homoserine kinase